MNNPGDITKLFNQLSQFGVTFTADEQKRLMDTQNQDFDTAFTTMVDVFMNNTTVPGELKMGMKMLLSDQDVLDFIKDTAEDFQNNPPKDQMDLMGRMQTVQKDAQELISKKFGGGFGGGPSFGGPKF